MKYLKYTKEQFIEAVKSSRSIREALKRLNLVPTGGNYSNFKRKVKSLELNISHFTGQGWAKGSMARNRRPISDYISNKAYIQSHHLKQKLIREGFLKHKCSKCQNTEWMGLPIPVELHHKDGNHENNLLANLQILCPNCHAQTPNHRRIKTKKV